MSTNQKFQNQDFSALALENLRELSRVLIQTDSYFFPDEERGHFQCDKKNLLTTIDESISRIHAFRCNVPYTSDL